MARKQRRKGQPSSNAVNEARIKDSAIHLGKDIIRNSRFIEGHNAPAFSRQIDTQLTYGEANLGRHLRLPKATNHIAQDLMTDLFWSMFQMRHVRKPNTPNGREFSRRLLDHLSDMPTFKNGRKGTLGKTASSIAASRALLEELLEDEEMREMMEQLSQMNGESSDEDEDEGEENENENSPDDPENNSGNQDDNGDDNREEPKNKQSPGNFEQQRQQDDLVNKLKEKLCTTSGSIGITAAVAEGFDKGTEAGKLIASLGMSENNMSPEDIEKVINVVQSEDFRKLSNLIGRSYGTAKEALRGRSTIPLFVDEAGYTKDVSDIFDDELAMMSPHIDPDVRKEQITRYSRSGLSGMTRTSQNQRGGTKIFALDESGSTACQFRDVKTGETLDIKVSAVERGFALGLARAAKSQGQSWYMFGWSSQNEYTETISHKDKIGKLMDFIAYNIDGGATSFDTALGRSMEIINGLPEDERHQTDIVVITDGQGHLSGRVIEIFSRLKREYGTRLYVITIGTSSNKEMEDIADYVLPFTSMAEASGKMADLMWIEREQPLHK